MLIISRTVVTQIIETGRVLDAVEGAFRAHGLGQVRMPPKVYLELPEYGGDLRAMPAFVNGAAGIKWVNSHPGNPAKHGKPTVMALLIYNDPETGEPLAVMDATVITKHRTAAASAIATKYLARPGSKSMGLIGCGVQALPHIVYIDHVMNLDTILLYDRVKERALALACSMPDKCRVVSSPAEAASADIVTTITPGHEKVLWKKQVSAGCHINAVGADALGKQEMDHEILHMAKVLVDDMAQATHSGEVSTPLHDGTYSESQILGTLGEVITGKIRARTAPEDITLFDSTGLAIQDIVVAKYLYARALETGLGFSSDII